MWTWSLAFMGFNSKSTSSQQRLLWEFSFAPMFLYLQKWASSTWACLSNRVVYFSNFLGLNGEISLFLTFCEWNNSACCMEPSGLCTAWIVCIKPCLASSEVTILLWPWCLQEVLRAAKKFGKNNPQGHHECKNPFHNRTIIRQARHFPTGTRVYLKKSLREQGREKRSAAILPIWLALISLKSQFAMCGCYRAGPPTPNSRNNSHEDLHTALEKVFINLSGVYWRMVIADSVFTMCQGMFWAFYETNSLNPHDYPVR